MPRGHTDRFDRLISHRYSQVGNHMSQATYLPTTTTVGPDLLKGVSSWQSQKEHPF